MFVAVKQGDILTKPVKLDDAKFLVGYAREGGSPLFAIMEHAGAVLLSSPGEKEFDEIMRISGAEDWNTLDKED